ncbi:hypothetical protein BA022_08260 [Diaphorobacter nitroreducens]|uniref:hypothetical protein n=1 Tax=Diaphorobacter nitroreducens TaxID=164759 RepID=UPI000B59F9FE|nr:hypothetical protein [Diaphorobacter nitroreducens]ASI68551.1 hypothetical protein BA022_08260 [Diaphorobacter nitroreducens]
MDDAVPPKLETIRMLFELDREDDPRLYDDLIRFKKGTKRINRLRLLAHEAVLGQFSAATGVAVARPAPVQPIVSAAAGGPSGAVFEMPAAADVFGEPLEN